MLYREDAPVVHGGQRRRGLSEFGFQKLASVSHMTIRFPVEPRDVPATKAARRLHLTDSEFDQKLPELLARGFPKPDPTTGMFDLDAIDEWRRRRHAHLFPAATEIARDARVVARERLEALKDG